MNKNLINFIISLRNASLAKKSYVKVKNVNILASYVAVLYKEGLILSYFVEKDTLSDQEYLIVNLRILESKVITESITLLSTPSKTKILSHSQLINAHLKHKYLFLSTSKGVFSHNDCLKLKLGGIAIFSC